MQSIELTDYCWCEQDICVLFWRTEISDAAVHIFKSRSFVVFDHDLCNLSTCPRYQIKFVEENALPTVNQLLTSLFPYATMSLCNLASHIFLQDHVSIMNGIKLLVLDSQESQPTSLVLLASLLKISILFPRATSTGPTHPRALGSRWDEQSSISFEFFQKEMTSSTSIVTFWNCSTGLIIPSSSAKI